MNPRKVLIPHFSLLFSQSLRSKLYQNQFARVNELAAFAAIIKDTWLTTHPFRDLTSTAFCDIFCDIPDESYHIDLSLVFAFHVPNHAKVGNATPNAVMNSPTDSRMTPYSLTIGRLGWRILGPTGILPVAAAFIVLCADVYVRVPSRATPPATERKRKRLAFKT